MLEIPLVGVRIRAFWARRSVTSKFDQITDTRRSRPISVTSLLSPYDLVVKATLSHRHYADVGEIRLRQILNVAVCNFQPIIAVSIGADVSILVIDNLRNIGVRIADVFPGVVVVRRSSSELNSIYSVTGYS
jgi:hypothetical protein